MGLYARSGISRWVIESKVKVSNSEEAYLKLPSIPVETCVKLLKSCSRLKSLVVIVDHFFLSEMPRGTFQADPGISTLLSNIDVAEIMIRGLDEESWG
jgi:hypothetical protein